ncbi:uncharacterized protein A4U43_C01F28200 [Asparagus officinalis]|uniref:histone acetyltransferase n=1 Tax=Asparagus officinalis TaxID=4686 RepID=A0A5P1FT10_ASPOF|nr:uncharacterized protein A4U43_C01F28200 [Asparagus officinalis]
MYKLGNNICASKEIIAHLWYVCKHCCHPILYEKQWVCSVCKNFHICEKCFLLEQKLKKKYRHPYGKSELLLFHGAQVDNIPACTIDDDDETIQSKIFDTRSMFLSHCRSNHYQFDTLRKAKHSIMMILYNLHNQFSPSISAGIGCWRDIETPVATVTDNTSQLTNQSKQVQSFQD